MNNKRQILIDADQFGFMGFKSKEEIGERINKVIKKICVKMKCSNYSIILSSKVNKRKVKFEDYKANRKDLVKPEFFKDVMDYMKKNYNCTIIEGEEADDIIGYFKRFEPSKYIIASQDKDILYNFSGNHFNLHYKRMCIVTVTPKEADEFYHTQLLTGDAIDNIPRLEINDRIIKRFKLSKFNKMTATTVKKIFILAEDQGLNLHETVKLCYTLADVNTRSLYNQIEKIYMGLDFIDLPRIKFNIMKDVLNTNEEEFIQALDIKNRVKTMGIKVKAPVKISYDNDFIIKFGKYKSKYASIVYKDDKQYLDWILNNHTDEELITNINIFYKEIELKLSSCIKS